MVSRGVASSELDADLITAHDAGSETRILIIAAPYYADVATALLGGARTALKTAGVSFECMTVAGALEIPQALAQAAAPGWLPRSHGTSRGPGYDGVIVIGCVIRGETSHYDIVCTSANHWLMETAIRLAIPVGNALLTVDTKEQAMTRADGSREDKGGDAARACLGVIALGRAVAAKRKPGGWS
jgi:6,7-dimethyl-8-ribityllumazine synthase